MKKNDGYFRHAFIVIFLVMLGAFTVQAGGTWTPLANQASDYINLMLLLSDGTVMAQSTGGNDWYRLTPDIHGSYVNGIWTALATMHHTRLYFSSDVLTNGTVLVAGAEYGTGSGNSEIYDPLSNVWTVVPVPPGVLTNGGFSDSISKILPDGNVLAAPDNPATNGNTAIYITASNTWSVGPKLFRGNTQSEASWVKLPDDSILTIDHGNHSERYIPSLNEWINDSNVGQTMYSTNGEMGAAFLLPDGQAFFLGGSGNTALYTPTGTTAKGTWVAGPVIPDGFGIEDGPAAMMVNGKILCAVGNRTNYNAPTYFFEYDPIGNSFNQVNGPTGVTDDVSPYEGIMLDLPDGTVLYSHQDTDLYVYQPDGSPLVAGKPAISNITENADGSFTLAGTLLNGISEGAAYGDDAQMGSNYPLVRLTNSAGNVYYERTYGWNSTDVMTSNKPVTTKFTNSAALPPGTYSLVVVANGIGSDPFSFTVPKLDQTITFAPLANKAFGEPPFAVSATAGSGLPVNFGILSGSATISGNNVTLTGTGTVIVRASQSGNANYNPAPNVDQPFTVYAPPQASITLSGNTFVISWPTNVPGFVLQSTPTLNPSSWSTVSPSPVIVNGQFTVTNNVADGNMFYRLQK